MYFNLHPWMILCYSLQCARVKEQVQQIERFQSEMSKYVLYTWCS